MANGSDLVTCSNLDHGREPHGLVPRCVNPTSVAGGQSATQIVADLGTIRKFHRATARLANTEAEVARCLNELDEALDDRRKTRAEVEEARLAFVKLTGKEVTVEELEKAWLELERQQ